MATAPSHVGRCSVVATAAMVGSDARHVLPHFQGETENLKLVRSSALNSSS